MTMTKNEISGDFVHELPEDLLKTLASDAEAKAAWEDLTPLARNEWICWAISVKKPETRRQHVERVRTELKEGMRRPCCWYGCIHRTDKAVSPSVQKVVLDKQSKKSPYMMAFISFIGKLTKGWEFTLKEGTCHFDTWMVHRLKVRPFFGPRVAMV